jgi:hypothetical protein
MFRFWAICGILIATLSPSSAQVSFDIAALPDASLLIRNLSDDFGRADPSLLTVFSSEADEASLATALTRGSVDLGFVTKVSPALRQALSGMTFQKVATDIGPLSGGEMVAIYPASPALEVWRFLGFIASQQKQSTLRVAESN